MTVFRVGPHTRRRRIHARFRRRSTTALDTGSEAPACSTSGRAPLADRVRARRSGPADQTCRYSLSAGAARRSSRSALFSSWRTRSRVIPRSAAELLERLRSLPVEAVAALDHVAHARLERVEGRVELAGAVALRGRLVGRGHAVILDHVGIQALAVSDRRLERDRVGDELEQAVDLLRRDPDLGAISLLVGSRFSFCVSCAPGAQHLAHLVADVHGEPNRSALIGECA